jgi:hypothetical protein
LAEVCRVLKISNPSDAATRLDDDEKMTLDNTEGHSGQRGGAQSFTIINESGLYSLILTSRKREAKRFKKWVTAEVLPSIRKTGGYGELSPALIGGMVKGILAKQLGETMKVITEQGGTIALLNERLDTAIAGFDPTQNVVTDFFTMHEILEKQRAHTKGRRGRSIRRSSRLRRRVHRKQDRSGCSPGQSTGPRDGRPSTCICSAWKWPPRTCRRWIHAAIDNHLSGSLLGAAVGARARTDCAGPWSPPTGDFFAVLRAR